MVVPTIGLRCFGVSIEVPALMYGNCHVYIEPSTTLLVCRVRCIYAMFAGYTLLIRQASTGFGV